MPNTSFHHFILKNHPYMMTEIDEMSNISTFTWKKGIGYIGLPLAILMHASWNLFGYYTASMSYLIYVMAGIYGTILIVIWRKTEKIDKS